MSPKLRLVVLGMMGRCPFGGQTWLYLNWLRGFQHLGHDVWYVEDDDTWPYDPRANRITDDPSYAAEYLARVVGRIGLGERWAYRPRHRPGECHGLTERALLDLYRDCDALLNICGATTLADEHRVARRRVYVETDPVTNQLELASGVPKTFAVLSDHDSIATYGENYGAADCGVPLTGPFRYLKTRQPVDLDLWPERFDAKARSYTTIGNWKQKGHDVSWNGETYHWSKHHEFLKFVDVPRRAGRIVELATNLGDPDDEPAPEPSPQDLDPNEIRGAESLDGRHARLLLENGWRLADGPALSLDPWKYRDYILSSKAEFTVAREFNVLPRSGWFSERSACYLAAGRPVVTQDTGFSDVLPTGEGLFAFTTSEEAVEAIRAIDADYPRHARAARAIAHDWFRAEVVLPKLIADLSL